jgi:predicted permease
MDTLCQDIRFAWRTLRKNPGFTVVAVLSLALGIGANTTIFTIVNAVFLSPLPVEKPPELVAVFTTDSNSPGGFGGVLQVSNPNFKDLRAKNEVFTDMAAYSFPSGVSLVAGTDVQQAVVEMVTGNYFDVLGVRAAVGRTFARGEADTPGAAPVLVISHGLWQRRFGGDPAVAGRAVRVNGSPFTIIGVAPEGFKGVNSLFSPDGWAPDSMNQVLLPAQFRDWFDSRRALLFSVVGRLRPGVSIQQAEANLKGLATALEREYPEPNKGRNVTVRPLSQATVFPGVRDALVLGGAVLMATVGLVLLIACSNVANLLMTKATARRQEVAVRVALGAARGRLVRQLLTESVVLALLGAVAGVLIASVARDLILAMRPPFVAQNFTELPLDAGVLAFTALIAVATGLLFGLLPSLQGSRGDVVEALKEEARTAGRSRRRIALGNALVVLQVALSLVALVAAGLFLRSLGRASEINPGFDPAPLAIAGVNAGQAGYTRPRAEDFFRQVEERTRPLPGVQSIAWASTAPLTGGFFRTIIPEGRDPQAAESRMFAVAVIASPRYFETVGIPIVRGRGFTDADREGATPVAVINQTLATRVWPGQDAIGRRFRFFTDTFDHEIVGVARDSKYNTIGEDPQIAVYVPLAQNFTESPFFFVRAAGDPAQALGLALHEIRGLDAEVPIVFPSTMVQVVGFSLWPAKMAAILLGVFGGLALALASGGLYGVMAYSVSRRQREIGLRMALGAAAVDVRRLVLREGMTLVGIGLAIGLAGALAVSRIVATLLYGVSPTDVVTFGSVSLLLAAVALVASYLPAVRASRVDPIQALR